TISRGYRPRCAGCSGATGEAGGTVASGRDASFDRAHEGVTMVRPVMLVILDGFGLAPAGPGNAVRLARTPVFDHIWAERPHTSLTASGTAVGLPEGQMGNSEVGHLNIGAGRVVRQSLTHVQAL